MPGVDSGGRELLALMERLRNGDEAALAELVDVLGPAVLRYSTRMLGDRAEAEDVMQETFVRVWRARGRWQPTAAVRTWTLTISTRLCLNRLRGWRRRPVHEPLPEEVDSLVLADDQADPEQALAARQMAEQVAREVSALPAAQRAALLLRAEGGLRYQEIAAALDTTAAAVESLLSRARSRLRDRLAGWLTEGTPAARG